MLAMNKPQKRPHNPCFSSGPCAKRPGWSLAALNGALLGRSHRSPEGKRKLKQVLEGITELLGLPGDYRLAVMAGSDTGAFEAALWSLLGPRPVDLFAWESFGKGWATDCVQELKLLETRCFVTDFGSLPDLSQADFDHDVIFTWNGTTSGVMVPNGDWIKADRQGLTFCDATSSVFAIPMPWEKLDVVTFSWQKVLGGEAQHGILILSPRAVARLETHTPAWPVPKIYRLTKSGKCHSEIFEGSTINTPSMLCVEDMLDALTWAKSIGGAEALAWRTQENSAVLERWVSQTSWVDFLATNPAIRSPTSVCLVPADPVICGLEHKAQTAFFKKLAGLLEKEGVAYDIGSYRDAPPGLRLWCGATVESEDLHRLTAWLDWAYDVCKADLYLEQRLLAS